MTEFYDETGYNEAGYKVETDIPKDVYDALRTLSAYFHGRGEGRSYLLCVPHEEDISFHKLLISYMGVNEYAPIPTEELN